MPTQSEQQLEDEAVKYLLDHKDELIEKFVLSKKPIPINFWVKFEIPD